MQLGAFSISLSVKDLEISIAFYEGLGFKKMEGSRADGWLVMKNGTTVIGLFQGMFERNMLTFNPGWDQDAEPLNDFEDIRKIQSKLKAKGYVFADEADSTGAGPASFMLIDPDGNPVFFDQHVSKA